MRTLRTGLSGQDVLDAQVALSAAQFYKDTIDGNFGPHMAAAVSAFQESVGQPNTGVLDVDTADRLGLTDPPAIESALPDLTPPLVSRLFPDTPLQNIADNLTYILNALVALSLGDRDMVLMALATIRAETSCFLPVSEGISQFNTSDPNQPFNLYVRVNGNQGLADAAAFRGRGFVQLTGRANYSTHSNAIFNDARLVNDPLLAHKREIAAKVLASFLKASETAIRSALRNSRLDLARKAVNGGSHGLGDFTEAFTAGQNLTGMPQLQTLSV